jgi:transcriptional regulator with XRE-family HTH domain
MIERFKQLLEDLKLSPSEFADRIGVQRSNISHILSGRNKPGLDFLEKMMSEFPGIDLTWLVTGKQSQVSVPADPQKEISFQTPDKEIIIKHEINTNEKPLLPGEEAVDHIIIVYKDNTFRMLKSR